MNIPNARDYILLNHMILSYSGTDKTLTVPVKMNNRMFIRIGQGAFSESSHLIHLTIPAQIRQIGAYAFSKCTNLKTAEISGRLPETGQKIFHDCPSLREISFSSLPVTKEQYKQLLNNSFISEDGLRILEHFPGEDILGGFANAADAVPAKRIPRDAGRLFAVSSAAEATNPVPEERLRIMRLIVHNLPTPSSPAAETVNDSYVRKEIDPPLRKTAIFCFDDQKTEQAGNSVLLNAFIRTGFWFWQSKVRIVLDRKNYYLYQKCFLTDDDKMEYVRVDAGLFSEEGPVKDEKTAEQIYAKYELLTIL